jgi:hypothetical protein
VTWAIGEKGYLQRRARGLVGLHPKTCRYRQNERPRMERDLAEQVSFDPLMRL